MAAAPSTVAAPPSVLSASSGTAAASSFTFGAAGDHSTRSETTAVLRRIGASGLGFFLSLGDLSYETAPPQAWCQYVKDNLNYGAGRAFDPYRQRYPFLLTEGNHDRATYGSYVATIP